MGYQPSLDGLRALSVAVVLLYHGGFSWMHGGFFGVEVFFVVSGFLITSLLLDEHDRHDRIEFRQFWRRRARRLFPALYAVLLAVGVWAALVGHGGAAVAAASRHGVVDLLRQQLGPDPRRRAVLRRRTRRCCGTCGASPSRSSGT